VPKNKKEIKPEVAKPQEETLPANTQSNSNTVLLVVIVVLLLLIILGGVCVGGWYLWKSKTKQMMNRLESQIQNQTQSVNQAQNAAQQEEKNVVSENLSGAALVYENKDFGFRLNFTSSWEKYRAESSTMGGDFEVGRTCFFLPTKYAEYTSELPEYTSPFCISSYVAYSWDEEQKNDSSGLVPMGEVVGRNSKYVFVYSHFNGDMPPDVPRQAILDMQRIAESIEVFESNSQANNYSNPTSETGVVTGGSSFSDPATGSRSVVDPDFQMNGVYYWNCKHRYTLTYPVAWSNNGMTYNSNTVILKGEQAQVRIEAVPITTTETLQDFAGKRSVGVPGNLAWVETVDWNGEATVFQATYRNPDSMALWWMAGDYGVELKAYGTGYNSEYSNIQKTIATLDPNITIPRCSSLNRAGQNDTSLSKTSDYKKPANTKTKSKSCSFPNGDVEYWWDGASASERDCFIQKGGIPPSSYEP